MNDFLYLYRGGQRAQSPEQSQQIMQKWLAWMKELTDSGNRTSAPSPKSNGSSDTLITRPSATITCCRSPRNIEAKSRARCSAAVPATRPSTSSPPRSRNSRHSSRSPFAGSERGPSDLRWLDAQVGQVADSLLQTLGDHGRARPDPCPGPFQHGLPDVGPGHEQPRDDSSSVRRGIRCSKPSSWRLALATRLLRRSRRPGRRGARRRESLARRLMRGPLFARGCPPPESPRRSVVPIDVHLGVRFQILVVTGPNTGGKTVALKTVGLLAIMAQSGLHVPGRRGLAVPVFDEVLADIGDEQSLEQSLSTFSSHVRRISRDPGRGDSTSLVLLDEMGAGTDPAEGAALGRAILDELDSIGCRSIVTTHIGDLKTYALANPAPRTPRSSSTIETLRPRIGCTSATWASQMRCKIARRLSLPEHVVEPGGVVT